MRRSLVPVLAAAALVGAATPAAADGGGVAVSINTRDGFSVFSFSFQIARTMKDVVDHGNAAVAFASCEDCQTVAVAIQVVLVMSDPSTVTPTNLALAYNYECTSCSTLASAYQYVFSTGGPVHFTADGNRRLAAIRRALVELMRDAETFTIEEIQARLEELTAELVEVLSTEMVAAGPPSASPSASPSPTGAGPDETGGTPAPSSSPSPEAAANPTPSPSGSASPSPSPEAAPSATPTPTTTP